MTLKASLTASMNLTSTSLGLLYQSGLFSDLFHDSMFLANFGEKLLWRHVILDHAQSGELGNNGRVLHRLFNSWNERFGYLWGHSAWREKPQPDAKEVLAVAELRQSRNLGIFRNLTRCEYSLHRSALHVAQ